MVDFVDGVAAFVGMGVAVAVGAGGGVAPGVGFGSALPYQSFTPLCPEQAPDLVAPEWYVPSLQSPVDPAGAPAGTCAHAPIDISNPVTTATLTRFMNFPNETAGIYRNSKSIHSPID